MVNLIVGSGMALAWAAFAIWGGLYLDGPDQVLVAKWGAIFSASWAIATPIFMSTEPEKK